MEAFEHSEFYGNLPRRTPTRYAHVYIELLVSPPCTPPFVNMARGGESASRRAARKRSPSSWRSNKFDVKSSAALTDVVKTPNSAKHKDAQEAHHKVSSHEEEEEMEFGGWPGALALMIWSHCMPVYMWVSLEFYGGCLFVGPGDGSSWVAWLTSDLLPKIATAAPTAEAWTIYGLFFFSQFLLFFVCPGVTVHGLPVPSENNRRYIYLCNAFSSWIFTLVSVFFLHYTGITAHLQLYTSESAVHTRLHMYRHCRNVDIHTHTLSQRFFRRRSLTTAKVQTNIATRPGFCRGGMPRIHVQQYIQQTCMLTLSAHTHMVW
jgi:hypothetical protein